MHITLDLQDMIDERITKIKAILDCLLAAWDSRITLDQETIYNTLWSIDDYLQEIIDYRAKLTETNKKN